MTVGLKNMWKGKMLNFFNFLDSPRKILDQEVEIVNSEKREKS